MILLGENLCWSSSGILRVTPINWLILCFQTPVIYSGLSPFISLLCDLVNPTTPLLGLTTTFWSFQATSEVHNYTSLMQPVE